jgi:hypothetical protein
MLVPTATPSRMPDGTAAAEVAADDAQGGGAGGQRGRPELVQPAGAAGDVGPGEQLGGALGDKLVASAVEAVAPNPGRVPGRGDGVTRRGLGHPLVESRFEEGEQGHAGQLLPEAADAGRVGRIVRGRDLAEPFERRDHPVIRRHATRDVATEDGLKTHPVQVGRRGEVTAGAQLR